MTEKLAIKEQEKNVSLNSIIEISKRLGDKNFDRNKFE